MSSRTFRDACLLDCATQQNNSPFSVEVDVNNYGDYWVSVQCSNRRALKVPCSAD